MFFTPFDKDMIKKYINALAQRETDEELEFNRLTKNVQDKVNADALIKQDRILDLNNSKEIKPDAIKQFSPRLTKIDRA